VAAASPESVTINVHAILIASVTSRRLTPQEIAAAGIVVRDENSQVWRYTVGFATSSGTFPITLDFERGPDGRLFMPKVEPFPLPSMGNDKSLDLPRPSVEPFDLRVPEKPETEGGTFGEDGPPPIPGFLVIPTDMAFLHQFFAVLVVVQNGALQGSGLVLNRLQATLELTDDGLRPAETNPPTVPGEPVPVVDPGPDGQLGTGDDLTFLLAQASGQASWLVEGLREGRHLVRVHLAGQLEGLASGAPVPVAATVPGVVVVRDPRFALTFFHPWTVRAGESYTFRVLVTNLSNTRVDHLRLSLPATGLTGCRLAEGANPTVNLGSVAPGEAKEAAWPLVSLRTGRVVASGFNTSNAIEASFRFEIGVGELGIPLSPESLVLPAEVDQLPETLRQPALELLGLAYSLANAPEGVPLPLPPVGEGAVVARGRELAACARRAVLGEPLDRVLVDLGLAWLGARRWNEGWDALRRASWRGHRLEEAMAGALARRMAALGAQAAWAELEELAITGRPLLLVRAKGAGYGRQARLVISGLGSGVGASGQSSDTSGFVRQLPGAAVLEVAAPEWAGEVAVVVPPLKEDGSWQEPGYQVQLHGLDVGTVELEAVVILPDGSSRRYKVPGGVATALGSIAVLNLPAAGQAAELWAASAAGGPVDRQELISPSLAPRPPARLLRLALDPFPSLNPVDGGPYRRILALLSQPLDGPAAAQLDLSDWRIASRLQLTAADGTTFTFERARQVEAVLPQFDPHFVVLVSRQPLNAHAQLELEGPAALPLVGGGQLSLAGQVVSTNPESLPAGAVRGLVVGGNGQPVPGAKVSLYEQVWIWDEIDGGNWYPVLADEVVADASGRFVLDAVRFRQGLVEARAEPFTLRVVDPATGHESRAWGRLRANGEVLDMLVTMVGRGDVVGLLRRADGQPLQKPLVAARSVAYPDQGVQVKPEASGRFRLPDLPVGMVQLVARDGNLVTYGSVAIPGPGQEASVELVLPAGAGAPTGALRGLVVDGVSGQPLGGMRVYAVAQGGPVDATTTAANGSFFFPQLPPGPLRVDVYAATGRPVATALTQVVADQESSLTIAVTPPATGVVRGTVYRRAGGQRTPVPGAYVVEQALGLYTVADGNGSYRLAEVPLGPVHLRALDPATGEQADSTVNLTAPGQELVVDLDLGEAAGVVEGYVVNRQGQPEHGVRVALDRFGAGLEATTDASGHFRLSGVRPGSHQVLVAKDERLGRASALVLYDGDVAQVNVTLGGTVSLVVKTVAATQGGGTADVLSEYRFRKPGITREGKLGLLPEEGWYPCSQENGCWLDEQGHAHLQNLPEGVGYLVVSALNPFYGEASIFEDLDPSDEGRQLVINFSAPGSVEGRVVDPLTGQPVEGAVVELWPGRATTPMGSAITGADGAFSFGLVPPGEFSVRALTSQGGEVRVGWQGGFLSSGQTFSGLQVNLRANGAAEGEVRLCNSGQAPAQAGQKVHLVLWPGAAPRPFQEATPEPSPLARRELDLDIGSGTASFVFTGLAAGTWNLSAQSPLHGYAWTSFTIQAPEQPVNVGQLCLLPAGSISGRVFQPETGQGVAGIPVQLNVRISSYGVVAMDATTTGSNGEFSFGPLPLRKEYRLLSVDPASGRGAVSPELRLCPPGDSGFGTTCWQEAQVPLPLAPLATLEGRLVTAQGEAVAGGTVLFQGEGVLTGSSGELQVGQSQVWAQTAQDGSFRFAGVGAGRVRLQGFDPASPLRTEKWVEVNPLADPQPWVTLSLPPTAEVMAQVTDPSGAPLPQGSSVTLLLHQSSCSAFGEPWGGGCELDRLAFASPSSLGWAVAGRYQVTACVGPCSYSPEQLRGIGDGLQLAPQELGARLEATMPDPPSPASVTLRTVARAATQVQVLANGQGVVGAEVTVSGNGFYGPVRVVTQTVHTDGTTDPVPNLGEGTYTVSAVAVDAFGNRRRGLGSLTITPADQGRTLPVIVPLEDAVAVRAQVLASNGLPAAGALVSLWQQNTPPGQQPRLLQGVVSAEGLLFLPAVPRGASFRLTVQEAGGKPGRFFLDNVNTAAVAAGETLDLGTLQLDDQDPAVSLVTPLNGQQEVEPSVQPVLRFSERMRPETLTPATVSLQPQGGNALPISLSLAEQPDPDGDGPAGPYTEVTIHAGLLASDTLYVVKVEGHAADLAGRTLGYVRAFSFRTADRIPPQVVGVEPAHDPQGLHPVGPNVEPQLLFSERLDPQSVSPTTVRLLDAQGSPVEAPPTLELDGFRVTLHPTAALALDRFYTLQVEGVKDLAGNRQNQLWSSTFRVRDDQPPVATLLPPVGAVVVGDQWRVGERRPLTLRAVVASNDAVARVTFALDGQPLGNGQWDGTSEYRLSLPSGLPPGNPSLSVTAVDVSGNPSPAAQHLLTVVDDAPPSGQASLSPAGSLLPNHEVTVSINASDDLGLAQARVVFSGVVSQTRTLSLTGTAATTSTSLRIPAQAPAGSSLVVAVTLVDDIGQETPLQPLAVTVVADTQPPTALLLSPSPEATVTAGEEVVFRFTLTDQVGVAAATLQVGDQQLPFTLHNVVLPGESWQAQGEGRWTAPAVSEPTSFAWVLILQDYAGWQTQLTGSLQVQPLVNPNAPVVTIACPRNGDPAVAGLPLTLSFHLADDDTLQSYTLRANGQVVAGPTPIGGTSYEGSVSWTLPASAQAGEVWQLEIEASDTALNVGRARVTVVVPSGLVRSGGGLLDASLNGQPLVLAAGTFTLTGPLAPASLVLAQGAVLTAPAGQPLVLQVAGDLQVACGAVVDMSGRGYGPGQTLEGAVPPGTYTGGSHMGYGGLNSPPLASTFGSVQRPQEAGGGSSTSGSKSAGGGVIRLEVGGVLRVDGGLKANGGNTGCDGGAGGSLWVQAAHVEGVGLVEASGSGSCKGGGGGAVALQVTGEVEAGFLARVRASGGPGSGGPQQGGAGTVYVKDGASVFGRLLVDNGGLAGQATELPALGRGVALSGSGGGVMVMGRGVEVSGLQGWWKLDEGSGTVAQDSAGGVGNGTLVNGPQWVAGKVGGGLHLDGSTQYVDLGTGASLPLGRSPRSLCAWAKPEALDSTWRMILAYGQAQTRQAMYLGRYGSQLVGGAYNDDLMVGGFWQAGVWSHVCVTYDGAVAKLYGNGVLVASAPRVWDVASGVAYLGRHVQGSGFWGGVIDDVRVYNRALTAEEVEAVYWQGPPAYFVGHWVEVRAPLGQVKGVYQIGAIEGNRVSLLPGPEGGPVDVAEGDLWQGVYRFDALTVQGKARLTSQDPIWAGTVQVAEDSQLVGPNQGPPTVQLGAISLRAEWRAFRISGSAGALSDPDGLAQVRLINPRTGWTGVSFSLNADGSFSYCCGVDGQVGDAIFLEVVDAHPHPLTTVVAVGTLPANGGPPSFAPDLASRLTFTSCASGCVVLRAGEGSVQDTPPAEPPLYVRLTNQRTGRSWTTYASANGSFSLQFDAQSGDTISLRVEDGHPQFLFAEVGGISVGENTAPLIDLSKIRLGAEGGHFFVQGLAGAVSDPDGIASAWVRNRTSGWVSWSFAVAADGSFGLVMVAGAAGQEMELSAKDAHPTVPLTTTVSLGLLPANQEPPTVDASKLTLARFCGHLTLTGASGAVSDPNGVVALSAKNQRTGVSYSLSLASDGSFVGYLHGAGGDTFTLTATDGHPQALSTTVEAGSLPANRPPQVDPAGLSLVYEEVFGYQLQVAEGAITDADENRLSLQLVNQRTGEEKSFSYCPGGAADFALGTNNLASGDLFTLTVRDDDEVAPASVSLTLGPLPNRPPEVHASRVLLLPMGFGGYQVVGQEGAVRDADAPVVVVLQNTRTGWSSPPLTVEADGSFYGRLVGQEGDEITLLATDGYSPDPQSTGPISLGNLPPVGVERSSWNLAGHVPAGKLLRGEWVLLDGGTAVGQLNGQGPEPPWLALYTGLTQARDLLWNHKLGAPMALDGGNLVGWDGNGQPVPWPLSSGTLVRGQALGDEFFLLAEEAEGLRLWRVPMPLLANGQWVSACGEQPTSLLLPQTQGQHALALLPAPGAQLAVLTDNPTGELLLVDLTTLTFAGSWDLPGEAPPIWGQWVNGFLALGRGDGLLQVLRFGDTGMEVELAYQDAQAVGALPLGRQLLVVRGDGSLQQVDFSLPSGPEVLGSLSLGSSITAWEAEGTWLALATDQEVVQLWLQGMPPAVHPSWASWGQGAGESYVYLRDILADSTTWPPTWRIENWDQGQALYCSTFTRRGPAGMPSPLVRLRSGEGIPGEALPVPSLPLREFNGWGPFPFLEGQPPLPEACSLNLAATGNGEENGQSWHWQATASTGQEGVRWRYSQLGSWEYEGETVLPSRGPVAGLWQGGDSLWVVASGLQEWSWQPAEGGSRTNPVLVTDLQLLGGAPVAAAAWNGWDYWPCFYLVANAPPRLAVVCKGETGWAVEADGVALPSLEGEVVALAEADGELWVLAQAGTAAKLYRYDLSQPSSPALLGQGELPGGAPPVALSLWRQEKGAWYTLYALVVRRGWGVEVYDAQLAPVANLPLPGDAQGIWQNQVALGNLGVAVLAGLPAAPQGVLVDANVASPGKVVGFTPTGQAVTPEGVTSFASYWGQRSEDCP
jgi:protocatechuate 3,4-dioxygenase beta subunit